MFKLLFCHITRSTTLNLKLIIQHPIQTRLFNGAIGNAYHWLYDPMMPYKDELTLLLGNKFDDFATKQEKRANDLLKENKELQQKNEELQRKIKELENKQA